MSVFSKHIAETSRKPGDPPDIHGYQVAKGLRAHAATRLIPLIALTGYGQLGDQEASIEAGFNADLMKPVNPTQIIATIEEVVAAATRRAACDLASPPARPS